MKTLRLVPSWWLSSACATLFALGVAGCSGGSDTGDSGGTPTDARADVHSTDTGGSNDSGNGGMDTGVGTDSGGGTDTGVGTDSGGGTDTGVGTDSGGGTDTGTGVDAGGGTDSGSHACGLTMTCGSDQACCEDPTAPSFGHCYATACLACCMGHPADAGTMTCLTNASCGAASYCAGTGCDTAGTCATRPTACTDLFDPVCGCNGHTYSNPCEAASAGERVESHGACTVMTDAGSGSGDASACSGPTQCNTSHPCASGSHCCTPIVIGGPGCGFCSTGACPG